MTPCVIAIVGSSGSGKTRLIEQLVPLLNKRGLKVGIVKHAHEGIDLDRPGKDSWRCLKAGAEAAAVVGPKQLLLLKRRVAGEGLDRVLENFPAELDLILLEGFHDAEYPQIAVVGKDGRARRGRCVIATVSDEPVRRSGHWFRPDQISGMAAFIEEEWMKQWEGSHCRPLRVSSSPGA